MADLATTGPQPGTPLQPGPLAQRHGLSFRAMAPADMAFLERLYRSTREDELARTDWSETQKRDFIAQQFQAQHQHYMQHYPDADWLVIERRNVAIGRLYGEAWPSQYRVIDIALLPEHRGHGYGAAIMRDLMDRAAKAGKAVSIHVEKFNPAMHLYHRLGFTKVEDKGVYDLMEWKPAPAGEA